MRRERAPRAIGQIARFGKAPHVAQRLGTPSRIRRGRRPRDEPLEAAQVVERGAHVAHAPPVALDELEHALGHRELVARAQQVGDPMADHAARAGGGVQRKRVGRAPEHEPWRPSAPSDRESRCSCSKVVRPAKATGAGGMRICARCSASMAGAIGNLERLQERAQADERNVAAERRGGVRGATELGRNRQDALVPELGGRARLLFERRGRHAVDAASAICRRLLAAHACSSCSAKSGLPRLRDGGALGGRPRRAEATMQERFGVGRAERTQLDDTRPA